MLFQIIPPTPFEYTLFLVKKNEQSSVFIVEASNKKPMKYLQGKHK